MSSIVKHNYLESLLKSLPQKPIDNLSWLKQLRTDAIDSVGKQKLPTLRDEDWRFTDISPLTKLPYQPSKVICNLQISDIDHLFLEEKNNRLVFVDGHYAPQLSNIIDDEGLVIGNISELIATQAPNIEPHLGQYAKFEDSIFTAQNTAFLQDGAFISVAHNTSVSSPVHLLFLATQEEVTSYTRCLLIGDAGSNVTLIEDFVSLQEAAYVTNAVTEISLAANAQAKHYRVQRENNNAFHLANCSVSLAHTSRYQSANISLGAHISRINLNVHLTDEAAECSIDGLTLISGRQLSDTHTTIDHLKPNGTSHQQHKCIIDDEAHAVFNGKIMVRPQAQRTNSSQSSRNLLLSGQSHIDTKPQLEI
ncbi:MAG: SufD family Fe-S cluster assembly protein, partial [Nitrosomonas sp.]|nr:SufD family Fe-S cluster assembly protein [Nitrosomonas sp.]